MRYLSLLSLLACAALLACGQEPAPTASGPAGRRFGVGGALAEIFSGKEHVGRPMGMYAARRDTLATVPSDQTSDRLSSAPGGRA